MSDSNVPQTFEEWWPTAVSWLRNAISPSWAQIIWDAAFSAGVASQQAKITELAYESVKLAATLRIEREQLAEKDREIERLKAEHRNEYQRFNTRIARYEAVVEAARELVQFWTRYGAPLSDPELKLRTALAGLEEPQ